MTSLSPCIIELCGVEIAWPVLSWRYYSICDQRIYPVLDLAHIDRSIIAIIVHCRVVKTYRLGGYLCSLIAILSCSLA